MRENKSLIQRQAESFFNKNQWYDYIVRETIDSDFIEFVVVMGGEYHTFRCYYGKGDFYITER